MYKIILLTRSFEYSPNKNWGTFSSYEEAILNANTLIFNHLYIPRVNQTYFSKLNIDYQSMFIELVAALFFNSQEVIMNCFKKSEFALFSVIRTEVQPYVCYHPNYYSIDQNRLSEINEDFRFRELSSFQ